MSTSPKLELTWIGKENRPKLEPRIVLEDGETSRRPEGAHPAAGADPIAKCVGGRGTAGE